MDDGIAIGSTMRAAITALNQQKPVRIIIAVPVAALSTNEELHTLIDKIICPLKPTQFHAVGLWYEDFSQTSDDDVIDILNKT